MWDKYPNWEIYISQGKLPKFRNMYISETIVQIWNVRNSPKNLEMFIFGRQLSKIENLRCNCLNLECTYLGDDHTHFRNIHIWGRITQVRNVALCGKQLQNFKMFIFGRQSSNFKIWGYNYLNLECTHLGDNYLILRISETITTFKNVHIWETIAKIEKCTYLGYNYANL